MMRYLLSLLFFTLLLFASDNSDILKRASLLTQSKEQGDIFRAYNDYKNLYLRSMVENDLTLKKESLEGIVHCGNKLKIDVLNYENELRKIADIKEAKTLIAPQVQNKKSSDIKIESMTKLTTVKWDKDRLLLKFDTPIRDSSIKLSTIHDNRFRYIFDIEMSMMNSTHNITRGGIDSIKVAQYDPQTIRLVIQNSSKVEVNYKIENDLLIIYFGSTAIKESPPLAIKNEPMKKSPKNKVVVIDAGHGGDDPGAIGFKKYKEKDIVFSVAKTLSQILKSHGYIVYMTRDRDVFVKLSDRTKFANEKGADIFVSVHANAVEGRNDSNGIETFFLSPSRSDRAKKVAAKENSADISDMNMYGKDSYLNLLNHHNILASNKLAIDIQRGVLGSVRKQYKDVVDNGVKEGPFWVLVGAQMPSILVEVGFVTNPTEGARLVDSKYQQSLASGLAYGIERYFANN